MGDREKNIRLAVDKINRLQKVEVIKVSSFIETMPVGGPAQGKFLNAAIEIRTDLSPYELLVSLQEIESELGRVRTVKNGPRTIDLDILIFGDKEINDRGLVLPHPGIKERGFVLTPLGEIAPNIVKGLLDGNNKNNSGINKRN